MEQSDAKAVEWYLKAAEQGESSAQYNLGIAYANGQGVEPSDAKAVEWLHKAAEQGDASAQYNLGEWYQTGRGVAQSYSDAYAWYYLSGDVKSARLLAVPGILFPAYCDAACALAAFRKMSHSISTYPGIRSEFGHEKVAVVEWTVAAADNQERMTTFLRELSMEEHLDALLQHGITYDTLANVTDDELASLHVDELEHRERILKAAAALPRKERRDEL